MICVVKGLTWMNYILVPLMLVWWKEPSNKTLIKLIEGRTLNLCQLHALSYLQYDLAWRDPLPHDCFALLLSDYGKILRKFINSLRSEFAIISLNPIAFFLRFFKQTVGSYVCNILLHPLLMAYVVEIGDNYADLSRKVLLPMYNAHHEFGPIPSKNWYMAQ